MAPPSEPFFTGSAEEGSDIRTIKIIVSITLGITMILAGGYLAAVVMSDGAILLRPSEVALERHTTYNELINPASSSLTGTGVTACIVDSGLAPDHSDLEGIRLVGWKDFVNGNGQPYDDHGHGTSMAGILVANGWLKGVAKNVDCWWRKPSVRMEVETTGRLRKPLIGVWPTERMSSHSRLGVLPTFSRLPSDLAELQSDAANEAIDAGVYVVAAAGNDGEDDDGDVAHPSSEDQVISVGGVTIKATSWSGSSKGDNNGRLLPLPILMPRGDPDKKPEVVAPAEGVPVLLDSGGWGIADGTSAATVYVTGALCLMLEANPELKPDGNSDNVDTVKQWMMNSAVPKEGQTATMITTAMAFSTCLDWLTSPLNRERVAMRPRSHQRGA